MGPIAIECIGCGNRLELKAELLQRVRGRTWHAPCPGCGAKIGLDARTSKLGLHGGRPASGARLDLDAPPIRHAPPTPILPVRPLPSPSHQHAAARHASPLDALRPPRVTHDASTPFGGGDALHRRIASGKVLASTMTWGLAALGAVLLTGLANPATRSFFSPPWPGLASLRSMLSQGTEEPATEPPGDSVSEPTGPAASPAADADTAISSEPDPPPDAHVVVEPETIVAPSKHRPQAAVGPARPSTPAALTTTEAAEAEAAPKPPQAPALSREALKNALAGAAGAARACHKPGDPPASLHVSVTMAPSGHVSSVRAGGRDVGTATANCVAGHFRAITIPAFSGHVTTVNKAVTLD